MPNVYQLFDSAALVARKMQIARDELDEAMAEISIADEADMVAPASDWITAVERAVDDAVESFHLFQQPLDQNDPLEHSILVELNIMCQQLQDDLKILHGMA